MCTRRPPCSRLPDFGQTSPSGAKMMAHSEPELVRWKILALVGAVLGGCTLAIYLWLMASQPDDITSQSRTTIWAIAMAIPCLIAVAGTLPGAWRWARGLLVTAAILFGCLGFVAMNSVGIGFLGAAMATGAAAFMQWHLTDQRPHSHHGST